MSFNCKAQNIISSDKTLPVVGYWGKGAKFKMQYSKTQTNVSQGKSKSEIISYNALWQVADSTALHYIIHLTYLDFNFINPSDSFNILFFQMFKNVRVKYLTNELGAFDSIINMKEIIANCRKGIDHVINNYTFANAKHKESSKLKLLALLNNTDLFKNSISEDLYFMHYFYGLQYKKDVSYTYDSELPNNLGGINIPSKSVYKLNYINSATNRIKLTCITTPVEKNFKTIMYESLVNYSKLLELPKPKKEVVSSFSLIHKCETEMSLLDGWFIKTTYSKIFISDTNKSTETINITFTP